MPGASLMMRFFGSPPRERRSASGPGTEADYQQGGAVVQHTLYGVQSWQNAACRCALARVESPHRLANSRECRAYFFANRTSPAETGLVGWA